MVAVFGKPLHEPTWAALCPWSLPSSPCTRNLKEGPKEKRKVHTQSLAVTAAVQEAVELRSSDTFMRHVCKQ